MNRDWVLARELAAKTQREMRAEPMRLPPAPSGKARILRGVTPEQYLRDPCSSPSLNASTAHVLVQQSPAHAYSQHPRLGGHSNGSTPAMDEGTVIHKLLLGKGKEIEIIDAGNWRTDAAKNLRDEALAAGKVPMLAHAYSRLVVIADTLRQQCLSYGIAFDGESEVAVEWTEEGVLCRAMYDHVWIDRGRIIDLKKTISAAPADLERSFNDYGYPLQWAAHSRGLAKLIPEFEGRIDMSFLFLEIEAPYCITEVRPDGAFREIGNLQWDRALHVWRECLANGRWPGYAAGPVVLNAPAYVVTRELGTWQA